MKITPYIKYITFFATLLSVGTGYSNPVKFSYELIERVIPGYSSQFIIEEIPNNTLQDTYEINVKDNKVLLRGNTGVAIATALNYYLKYTCNVHISWTGKQINLPSKLPLPINSIKGVINGKHRVYMNYCTLSYSAPWWDWERWQQEIDYMAMNGINMPLAVTGLEAVWYNTLLKFNFTDTEARKFLAGPAHLAWQWMQNIQSYGGPLPKSWIDSHLKLGQKILQRERELGMTPIMQGFSGYVPREMKEKFPQSKIAFQSGWGGFNKGAAQIDPTDELFERFGKEFLKEEEKLFGKNNYYAADPFHESAPPINTPEYLNAVGVTIYNLYKSVNNNAIWVMQSWSLRKEIVMAVPKNDLLILDLGGKNSKTENFWGYPFIYGTLHNFGGRINLHGDLNLMAKNQYELLYAKAPNLCGTGFFMEGINHNTVFFDLAFEMNYRSGSINVHEWLKNYATRRYGSTSVNAQNAWELLLKGPYNIGTNQLEYSSIIAARPALDVKKSGPNAGFKIPYSEALLYDAQKLLLEDVDKLKKSSPYRFDLIDIQRQIMTNLGQTIHKKAIQAYRSNDKKAFKLHSQRFIALLEDTDRMLRCTSVYNFDKWLHDARSWGNTPEEKDLFEKDATSLLTIWGYEGKVPTIFDYAWREWSGLIDGFYKVRWKMFYDMLQNSLDTGVIYSEQKLPQQYGKEAFRANDFYNKLGDFEESYIITYNKQRSPITAGNDVALVKKFYKKYKNLFLEYHDDLPNIPKNIDNKKTYENLGNN
ncbi:alpha-N-acetylglucosaminidase [Arcicella rosea]|uniref:Alpha-N-acetylglucosaminidase n=1 Tax=Arcicella rosea TaxID=502909 RepID=A0A841EHA8_9BACT|nr:alpha-N-acetylglucosaminidase [Arcicella rosea]MBB6002545.1 alpha-N-acetylglucosaminidase [Arcicella rosea]